MAKTIDINCDLGESFGSWKKGADEELLPHITTASVACGFHAGDPVTMLETVELAAQLGVAVGAHPGLPDLLGFGRRQIDITADEAYAYVAYQVGSLSAFLRARGLALNHVKPHGAFYGMLNGSPALAEAAVRAIVDVMPAPVIYWPAGVEGLAFVKAAQAAGVHVVGEYFPDLSYKTSGEHIVERHKVDLDPAVAAERVRRFLVDGLVDTVDGDPIPLEARSICVHGDGPTANAIVTAIVALLETLGYRLEPATAGLGRPTP